MIFGSFKVHPSLTETNKQTNKRLNIMRLQATKKELLASTVINDPAKQWAVDNWQYLTTVNTPLINVNSSTKIEKGQKLNIHTGILYLKPADQVTTKTLCPTAQLMGCKKGCLIDSGQLGKKPVPMPLPSVQLCLH
jgi:hypothetical protein